MEMMYRPVRESISTMLPGRALGKRKLSGFKSTKVKEERDLLYDATCVVCGEGGECLYIECNACEKKLLVFEQGDGKCSCGFEAGLEWLVDTLGPATDPKEDSEVAYCSECEYTGTPTAIPLDDGERYFCVSCFTSHADAERCGWCNELVTGIDSTDSYLSGCVMCEGRLGHDTD